jgi:DNA-binding response OmpR family regulator
MIKVLLIDDDRRHSELLQAYCRRFGVEIDCAFDGEQGLRRLASNPPDLLLLDVMLPGKDGFEICREIRRRSSRLPIIMLTARADVVDRVSGLELGADDYIGKPFEPRELVARIHTILRRVETRGSRVVLNFEGLVIDTATRTVQIDAAILTRSVDILVSRLRAKLGDSLKPARFIQTVWGRGYCFVARPLAE